MTELWCRNTGEAVDLKIFPLGPGTYDLRDPKLRGIQKKDFRFFYEWQKTVCYTEAQGRKKGNFQIFESLEHPNKGAKKQPQLFHIRTDQIISVFTVVIPLLPDLGFKPLNITYKGSVMHLSL